MKDALIGLAWLILMLLAVASVVVMLADMFGRKESTSERSEREFRTVCSQLKGQTVWNGRQWECLK
jgi:beta-lactamase regulating signal transducer with metallopeptidase domain